MIDMSRYRAKFMAETRGILAELRELLARMDGEATTPAVLEAAHRGAHSIKGAAGMFGFARIGTLAAELEQLFACHARGELAQPAIALCAARAGVEAIADLLDGFECNVTLVDGYEAEALGRLVAAHSGRSGPWLQGLSARCP